MKIVGEKLVKKLKSKNVGREEKGKRKMNKMMFLIDLAIREGGEID